MSLSYIFVQILGGYIACAGVYFPFRYLFLEIEEVMGQRGVLDQLQFTSQGPSGVFAFYVPEGQTLWGAWLSEFLCVSLCPSPKLTWSNHHLEHNRASLPAPRFGLSWIPAMS
jgi:glycerol uptake facilitator-like aquaporin